jgi:hypothetical protein
MPKGKQNDAISLHKTFPTTSPSSTALAPLLFQCAAHLWACAPPAWHVANPYCYYMHSIYVLALGVCVCVPYFG